MKKFLFLILFFASVGAFPQSINPIPVPAPGAAGNMMRSDGKKWTSAAGATCTPTSFTAAVSTGTWTTNRAYYCDDGSKMYVTMKLTNTAAGSGVYNFTLPNSKSFNTTMHPASTIGNNITTHILNAGPLMGGANWTLSANAQIASVCESYVTGTTTFAVLCGGAASGIIGNAGNDYLDRAMGLGSSSPGAGSNAYVTVTFEAYIQ